MPRHYHLTELEQGNSYDHSLMYIHIANTESASVRVKQVKTNTAPLSPRVYRILYLVFLRLL